MLMKAQIWFSYDSKNKKKTSHENFEKNENSSSEILSVHFIMVLII